MPGNQLVDRNGSAWIRPRCTNDRLWCPDGCRIGGAPAYQRGRRRRSLEAGGDIAAIGQQVAAPAVPGEVGPATNQRYEEKSRESAEKPRPPGCAGLVASLRDSGCIRRDGTRRQRRWGMGWSGRRGTHRVGRWRNRRRGMRPHRGGSRGRHRSGRDRFVGYGRRPGLGLRHLLRNRRIRGRNTRLGFDRCRSNRGNVVRRGLGWRAVCGRDIDRRRKSGIVSCVVIVPSKSKSARAMLRGR